MRAPFQVLIFPFIKEQGEIYYGLFKRNDLDIWQAIAGGGEDNEMPLEAAKREAFEEAMIKDCDFIRLSSTTAIPAKNIHGLIWGDIIMVPEIAFGAELPSRDIKLSDEHRECQWLTYEEAISKLKYDSNKSALWELDYRLKNDLRGLEENKQNIIKYYA